jgi:hypothetical protein
MATPGGASRETLQYARRVSVNARASGRVDDTDAGHTVREARVKPHFISFG